ncbi:hypothetical protein HU200_036704 [Digitaria exilis]|uniref:DELLA protein n=1 Tax=Digitaria exilis TaxID=1010633 RepID=A0A835EMD4_9POAL|nr:hypothetical protein HU200_036704 [Digitaria exilis]
MGHGRRRVVPFQWPSDPGLDAVALPPLPTVVPDAAAAGSPTTPPRTCTPPCLRRCPISPRRWRPCGGRRRRPRDPPGPPPHELRRRVEAGDPRRGVRAPRRRARRARRRLPVSGIGRVAVHFSAALSLAGPDPGPRAPPRRAAVPPPHRHWPALPPGRDDLRDVGVRLADLARSVRVHFSFRGVAANRLDEVRPWMLQVSQGEAVAVNSVLQLHRLVAGDSDFRRPRPGGGGPIDAVLECVASMRPRVFAVVEQEADHNKAGFLDRFTEALFYYSAVFDSLDAASGGGGAVDAAAEAYLEREICDIVLGRAGLAGVPLGANALRQARMLVGLFSGEGHCVEEADGCLTLGWHGRPLFSASAWRAEENNHQSDSNADASSSGGGSEESNISCSS